MTDAVDVQDAPNAGGGAGPAGRFPALPAGQSQAELEAQVLARWDREGLFARAQAARAGGPPFVFYEGPPTANGRPGIHHVFARTVKDLVCRHRAMRGHDVPRKAGWDTHGLPVEIEVEKRLGISGKQDIERYGVVEFNRLCRESVFTYRAEWEQLSARMGYWLDYDRPYVTYSNDYVESVWWALRTLHDKGLLYQGHKILPYCPRCETSLSSHEVAQGYQDVEGPSVYVALDLEHQGPGRRRIVVWTTTPWTLVSNTALAVHPELAYVELRKKSGADWTVVLAEARAAGVLGVDWADCWDVVATVPGRELVGARYRRPIDWVEFPREGPNAGAHGMVVGEEFVSADDGSGVVHMAPAFGADDYAAGRRHGLAFVQPVDARGRFDAGVPVVGGQNVHAAAEAIVAELKARDLLWKAGTRLHSYPHCWRCGTPLLYYARSSWFVRTTAYRDAMLARNGRVDWHPEEVGSGRFGQWLENNIDWAVSRDRYWGTPLPVWVNDADPHEVEVVGSFEELRRKAGGGALPDGFDPHKPFIDEYTWPAPSGTGTMRRVPEVIDAWFDSGSMPFAQWHFPFENRELVERQFPADFIAEGVDQTRGWFYSLLAIATGLGDALPNNAGVRAAPYRAVVVNNQVVDAQGKKMSKSRGNAVDPWAVIQGHGVDAVRLFFMSVGQLAIERRFDEAVIREGAGRFLITLKNVYAFFSTYANFGWSPSGADPAVADRPPLDRWVLGRLARAEQDADALLGAYDPTAAARRVMEFFDADVSKWWLRLSRPRFWFEGDRPPADARAALATLHEVLVVTARLLAPFAPFVTDWLHRALTGGVEEGQSVHLAPYVRALDEAGVAAQVRNLLTGPDAEALDAAVEAVRRLATLGRAAREAVGINVRQPLGELVAVAPGAGAAEGSNGAGETAMGRALHALADLLAAELNVKQVRWATSSDALVTLEAKPNFRHLGKRFGKGTPRAAAAVAALSPDALRAFERGVEVSINVDGAEHALEPDDLSVLRRAAGAYAVQEEGGFVVALDPTVTPALRAEGIARELVSRVQRLRKEAGLEVSDRIRLLVEGPAEVAGAAEAHRGYISGETLAVGFTVRTAGADAAPGPDGAGADDALPSALTRTVDLDGAAVRVTLSKDTP